MFLYEKTHRYLKNDYQFFDALKTKDCKIREKCNILTKVKFHEMKFCKCFGSSVNGFFFPSDLNFNLLSRIQGV